MRNARLFSIQGRFFLPVTAVIVFIFFIAVAVVAYSMLYERQQSFERDLGQRLTRQVSDAMSLWLKDKVHLAQVLAASDEVMDVCSHPEDFAIRQRAEEFLRQGHAAYEDQFTFMSVMYLRPDPDKALILEKNGEPVVIPNGASILDSIGGRSIGIADLSVSYVKAIVDGKDAFISEAKANVVPGLPPLFVVTAPIRDGNGRLAGIFGFGIKLEHVIKTYISSISYDSSRVLDIVDDRALYVGQIHASLLLNSSVESHTRPVLRHLQPDKATDFFVEEKGEQTLYVGYPVKVEAPMANTWWVLYHRPAGTIQQELRPYFYSLATLVILGSLVIIGIAANTRAASLRVSRQETMRRDAERKSLYVDNAPYGLLLLDHSGRIEEANPAASRFFGYEPGALVGISIFDLIPGYAQVLRRTPAGDTVIDCELATFSARHKDGEEIYVAAAPRPLDNEHTMLFIRGVTELVRQQQKAKELTDKLNKSLKESERLRFDAEAASQAKSEFLANMSHEIRTPMNAVMGMSQLLVQSRLDDRQLNFVTKINMAARSLLGIINDILDFSKIEAGHMNIEHIPFSIKETLDSLHVMFARSCEEKGITLVLKADPSIPPMLLGDPLRLGQTLNNLVSNAVKFTHTGGIIVTCTVEKLTAARAYLRIDVEDSGIGIEEKYIDHLFSPFTQADSSTTRQYGGTGLGLAISNRLVGLMGGILSVRSQRGIGSIFSVSCVFDIDQRLPDQSPAGHTLGPEDIEGSLAGRSILLVEDIEINQEVAVELLRQTGASITVASNGKEAVDLVSQSQAPGEDPYDIILMDIQMPVLDGYKATKKLREMGVTAPIIAMTAHAMVEERKRCLLVGMDDHIAKPIDLRLLLEAILQALKQREQGGQ